MLLYSSHSKKTPGAAHQHAEENGVSPHRREEARSRKMASEVGACRKLMSRDSSNPRGGRRCAAMRVARWRTEVALQHSGSEDDGSRLAWLDEEWGGEGALLGRRWRSTLATNNGGLEWQGRLRLAGGGSKQVAKHQHWREASSGTAASKQHSKQQSSSSSSGKQATKQQSKVAMTAKQSELHKQQQWLGSACLTCWRRRKMRRHNEQKEDKVWWGENILRQCGMHARQRQGDAAARCIALKQR
jgi:hypothetical protein